MRALVTGAAGFIGSHLSEAVAARGYEVVGIDCFTDYYDPEQKRRNVRPLLANGRFVLVEADLTGQPLTPLLSGVDIVFHLAGQPGVRASWGTDFDGYARHNILATQRLLEAVAASPVRRLVVASSSSVYGRAVRYPTRESALLYPVSPYGVTKLATEHLVRAYVAGRGLPAVLLRYFSVYGPRQRPDMAVHRLITAAFDGVPFPMNGDGHQRRDFTYVGDVVTATVLAGTVDLAPGTVLNVGAGRPHSIREAIALVEELTGRHVTVRRLTAPADEVDRTGACTDRAAALLGWSADTGLREGLRAQLIWQLEPEFGPVPAGPVPAVVGC